MNNIQQVRFLSRRGLKELDILLSRYIDHYYATAGDSEKTAFGELLLKEDQEILDFILIKKPLDNSILVQLQGKLNLV